MKYECGVVPVAVIIMGRNSSKAMRKSDKLAGQSGSGCAKKRPGSRIAEAGLYKCCFENRPLGLAAASFNGHPTQKQVVAA